MTDHKNGNGKVARVISEQNTNKINELDSRTRRLELWVVAIAVGIGTSHPWLIALAQALGIGG